MSLVRCFISPAWLEITFVEARESPDQDWVLLNLFVITTNVTFLTAQAGLGSVRAS